MFFMVRLLEVGKLVVFKYESGFMDYFSAGLTWGSMPCFVSIVPHAPCSGDNEFK